MERIIATAEFDVMQIHYNLMYQSACDGFVSRGVIHDADVRKMGIVLMRSTTSGTIPKLMRQCFPQQMQEVNLDGFLLNYAPSNPLVDTALMSLESIEDVDWTNAVSDNTDTRLNLRQIHQR